MVKVNAESYIHPSACQIIEQRPQIQNAEGNIRDVHHSVYSDGHKRLSQFFGKETGRDGEKDGVQSQINGMAEFTGTILSSFDH